MERPRVLVVEDRPSVRTLVATVLERGYEVTAVGGGAEALEALGGAAYDVVLTDVRMPGATGFDVLRGVRERSPRTAVVLMTAYATVPDAVTAVKLGAYDYLAKPIDADELSLVVARAAEHARRADGAGPLEEGVARVTGDAPDLNLGFRDAVEAARERASRRYLTELMQLFRGNVTHAATRAAMTRESLHRVLRQHGISSEQHRAVADAAEAEAAEE